MLADAARRQDARSTSAAAPGCSPSRSPGWAPTVTGLDASPELIAVAARPCRAHGASRSTIAPATLQELEGQFDLVTCMEVIEHVADPPAFVDALAERLAPGGLLILSTPNATGWSKLLMITIGEGLGRIPRGHARFRQVHRARSG